MKKNMRCFFVFIFVFNSYITVAFGFDQQGYRIGSGDILSINVFGEKELSLKKVRVGSNGIISVPLLGEIVVKKMSISEFERELVRRFKDGYLKKPIVTIKIDEYRLIYVNGEVKNPAGYNFLDDLTVQKAITLAGGFGARADKSTIFIERDWVDEKIKVGLNDEVFPGDVITVEESFF